jgi:hypothetical protein
VVRFSSLALSHNCLNLLTRHEHRGGVFHSAPNYPDYSGYYDLTQYNRFYHQNQKDEMHAMQYYAFLQQMKEPVNSSVPIVPAGLPTFALMSYNASSTRSVSQWYRTEKMKYANTIAGGNLTGPVLWWTPDYGQLNFTVSNASWVAEAIIGLGL